MRERMRMTAPAVPLRVGAGSTQGSVARIWCAAAGEVVAELVDEQNAQQGEGKGPAGDEEIGMIGEPSPGPEVAIAHHGRHASRKFCMKRAPLAVVVTTLAASSSSGQAILPKG